MMKLTSPGIEIVSATTAEAALVAGLIATAFHDLEVARWQIPDDNQRRALFPAMFEEYVHHALECGSVEMAADLTAAAVWTVETGEPKPVPKAPEGRMASALGDAAEKVHEFDLALHEHEPDGTRFEKLALLAVRPGCQNQGFGSALLAYHLSDLDRRLVPAYLEASNKTSRELYRRYGFRDHGEPIKLPHGPLMFPMWREPPGVQHS
jgi:ribosomal protein S18 acetylase RimI-like enzyme